MRTFKGECHPLYPLTREEAKKLAEPLEKEIYMVGTKWKNKVTGEQITIANKREVTVTLFDVRSSWGDAPQRTRVIGKGDLNPSTHNKWERV